MPSIDSIAGLQRVVVRTAGGVLLQHVISPVRVAGERARRSAVIVNAVASDIGRVDCRRTRLTEIEEPPQMMTLRSNIRDLHYHLVRELLLEVDVVVVHVRGLDMTVESENVTLIF